MRGLLDNLIAHAQTTRSIRQIVMVERVGEALQGDGCDFLFQREERNVLSELLFFPDFKRSFHRNRNQIAAVHDVSRNFLLPCRFQVLHNT